MSKLDTQIDALFKLKAKHKKAQAVADEIDNEVKAATQALMDAMGEVGTGKAASKLGSVTVKVSVVPQVVDWEKFYAFIHKKKYYHLLERRPAVTGCRELFEGGNEVPGVTPFTKHTLLFTPAK